jgi:hypothetical protein
MSPAAHFFASAFGAVTVAVLIYSFWSLWIKLEDPGEDEDEELRRGGDDKTEKP